MTVPDQAYSIREILVKFASGTLPDIYQEPEFSEDLPDLRGLDISQIDEMKKSARKSQEDLKLEIEKIDAETITAHKEKIKKVEPPKIVE